MQGHASFVPAVIIHGWPGTVVRHHAVDDGRRTNANTKSGMRWVQAEARHASLSVVVSRASSHPHPPGQEGSFVPAMIVRGWPGVVVVRRPAAHHQSTGPRQRQRQDQDQDHGKVHAVSRPSPRHTASVEKETRDDAHLWTPCALLESTHARRCGLVRVSAAERSRREAAAAAGSPRFTVVGFEVSSSPHQQASTMTKTRPRPQASGVCIMLWRQVYDWYWTMHQCHASCSLPNPFHREANSV